MSDEVARMLTELSEEGMIPEAVIRVTAEESVTVDTAVLTMNNYLVSLLITNLTSYRL